MNAPRLASLIDCSARDLGLMVGAITDDGHESAAFIEIETCHIAQHSVYALAVEAVQGRTAWSRHSLPRLR